MATSWGKDNHGPGGDPSWLGGKDRGTGGEDEWAPRFGESAGEGPTDQERGAWAEGFEVGRDPEASEQNTSIVGKLLAVLSSLIGLIIIAVVMWRMGFDQWWLIVLVGIPFVRRLIRTVRKSLSS